MNQYVIIDYPTAEDLMDPHGKWVNVFEGVHFYEHGGHGWYFLNPRVNERIPEAIRKIPGWYEEDHEARKVRAFIPEAFSTEPGPSASWSAEEWAAYDAYDPATTQVNPW